MPTLRKLTCKVEWSDSDIPLAEHNTSYADGFVKTYIAVPSRPTPFSIRLRSNGYVAPGLAMFVYMDGVYQCNRNRHSLRIPDGTSTRKHTEVNFHVRQKEEMMQDGTFRAKPWRFQKFDVVTNPSELKNDHVPHGAQYVGTIEVIVLRCNGLAASNTNISQPQMIESTFLTQALNPSKPKWFNPNIAQRQSSDDDSWSSVSSASGVGGTFDGACDCATNPTGSMDFGGDMAWDDHSPNQGQPQRWKSDSRVSTYGPDRSLSRGPGSNTGMGPQHSGAHDLSQNRFSQDWGATRSENKRIHNSPKPQANTEQNSSSAKSKTSSLIVPGHSPAGSAKNRNVLSDPAAADAPTVVININNGNRPRREPKWTEALEVNSANQNVPWQNTGQDDNNSQSERSEKQSPNGSSDHEGSKKSNYVGGSWQAQPDYGDNGGNRGYSRPDNWETAQLAMPGGWDTSNDQHQANNTSWDNDQSNNATTWKATNEPYHWNTNENHESGWNIQGNNGANTWENSNAQGQGNNSGWNAKDNGHAPGWGVSTPQNQGQNQQWNSNEKQKAAQNNWAGDGGWNDNGSNQQNSDSPGNDQDPAAQSWGGQDEDNNCAWPTHPDAGKTGTGAGLENVQSKRIFSAGGSQEKPSSPFRFMDDPNHVNQPSSPHPSRKQSSPQAAWVQSGGSVPGMAPQQSPPPSVTHDGPNAPQTGSFPSVGPGLPETNAFQPKPYWSSWKQENDKEKSTPFAPAFASVEPLCKVPSEVAQRNNTSHQVHVGQSVPYAHRKASPKYMDSHDDPYAVFVFHYRSRAILEQILNTKLTETEAEGRLRMQAMSKDELIEQILKAKAKTTWQGSVESESSSASNKSGGSKNTIKGNNIAYEFNRQAADGVHRGAVNQQLSQFQMHGNNGSGKGSTHRDARWGGDVQGVQNKTPSLDHVPTTSNHERVTGWLGSDHGGGGGGGDSVHQGGSGNGGGGEKWNGTANWTGQQGEGRGNGNWNYDNNQNQNVGSGGSGGGGGVGWGGQATGSWQGAGGNAAGGGGGNTAAEENKW